MTPKQEALMNATSQSPVIANPGRAYSHAGGAKTFIDEKLKAPKINWVIENTATERAVVVIGHLNNSQFASQGDLLAKFGANVLLSDGAQVFSDGNIIGTSQDTGRKIQEQLRFGSNSPWRMTTVNLQSLKSDGSPDFSNFTNSLKTVWVNPFSSTNEENFYPLRTKQSGDKFNNEYVDIDLIQEGFPVIVSNEHFTVLTVEAGTKLFLTIGVGMQMSAAQAFYRQTGEADKALAGLM